MRSYSTSLASLSTGSVPAPSPLLPRESGLPPRTEDLRTNGRAVSGQGLQPPGCSVGNGRGLPPGIPDRAPRAGRAMSAVCTASPRGPRETGGLRGRGGGAGGLTGGFFHPEQTHGLEEAPPTLACRPGGPGGGREEGKPPGPCCSVPDTLLPVAVQRRRATSVRPPAR